MELKKEYFIKTISKKKQSLINSAYLNVMGIRNEKTYGKGFKNKMKNRSKRVADCLSYWEWDRYEKNKVMDLVRVFRCKDVYCPNCRTWNNAKSVVKFTPYFKNLMTQGSCPYFMTLTVPNIKGKLLGEEINKLNKGYAKLWKWLNKKTRDGFKDRIFHATASIRVIELTVNNKTGLFNVHIHAIIFLENEQPEYFVKKYDGGYRYKSKENIFYSDADIHIQKLWTMAYKNIKINHFTKTSDYWKDNLICDIRVLELSGGIYEIFKYVFKDVIIDNIEIFENIFFGLENRRLRQGYGKLFGLDKEDININEMVSGDKIETYLEFDEEPEKIISLKINEMIDFYKEYKKVSRFKTDVEYESLKE